MKLFHTQRRHIAQFGIVPLSHTELLQKYTSPNARCVNFAEFTSKVVPQLEALEEHISRWRLGKWMFRVPVLLPSHAEKEAAMTQLDTIKAKWLEYVQRREDVKQDVAVITQSLGMSGATRDVLATLTRTKIHDHITTLRWNGDVDTARKVRAAWERMEVAGASDAHLLDRMCCVYGLLRNNCFENAFGNVIRKNPATGKIVLDRSDALRGAAETILTNVPSMDIYYSFLGYDPAGYSQALGRYIVTNLSAKYKEVEFRTNSTGVVFEAGNHQELLCATSTKFVHVQAVEETQGKHFNATLLLVASSNRYEREGQIPKRKELDAVERRLSFLLGVPPESVRSRVLFLPPAYLDKVSLSRLHEMMGGAFAEEHQHFQGQYTKELTEEDQDYTHQRSTLPQEDWATL
jgi:hypothetical protein